MTPLLPVLIALPAPVAAQLPPQDVLCPKGSLLDYTTLFGPDGGSCRIDDKLFSDFVYSSSAAGRDPRPGTEVALIPISTPLNPGFELTALWAPWEVEAGQILVSTLLYRVEVLPGGHRIKDVALWIEEGDADHTGDGAVRVVENVLVGGWQTLRAFHDGTGVQLSDAVEFLPTIEVLVVQDIRLFGGENGSAELARVFTTFSEVSDLPEVPVPGPLALVLIGSGLLALGVLRPRPKP